jgi:hypothetical protein
MEIMVFLNITWMESYDGYGKSHAGGSYVEKHGYGGEMYNFKEVNGKVYGYVQPHRKRDGIFTPDQLKSILIDNHT